MQSRRRGGADPRRFLVIVPDVVAPPGLLGEAIIGKGCFYDTLMPTARYASHAPFDYPGVPRTSDGYAGLVVLGGGMSANDVAAHPFLVEVMTLVRRFDEDGKPVLGVCLGAQIVARSYGGEVYRMGRLESGFCEMELTAEGRADPLFSRAGDRVTVFHNHYEAVRNVPGAVVLATGGACPVQAFRIGERVYGLQWHIEVTIDIVREWIRTYGHQFCRDEPRLVTDLDRQFGIHFPSYRRACRRLVERWMALGSRPPATAD